MRRKKIKYDVAKNGEEAVQKWHNGGFHLILVIIRPDVDLIKLKFSPRWTSKCLLWTAYKRQKRLGDWSV